MTAENLIVEARPRLTDATMLLGFSGWMNGGDVSTGTIDCLIEALSAKPLARIEPEPFYIYNFPGSMEVSAPFRPHARIEEGRIVAYEPPENRFWYNRRANLVLFRGREPNFQWRRFADCIFEVARAANVRRMYFIGSVAGVVPHTRDPRMFASVSHESIKEQLEACGIRFSNYEGPASFITLLTVLCCERGAEMASLVAEIPAYIHGANPRCIESVVRRLGAMLELPVSFDELRTVSDVFERKVSRVIAKRPELTQLIEKLETDYDNEVFDTQMGDLKSWLEQQGIRLD